MVCAAHLPPSRWTMKILIMVSTDSGQRIREQQSAYSLCSTTAADFHCTHCTSTSTDLHEYGVSRLCDHSLPLHSVWAKCISVLTANKRVFNMVYNIWSIQINLMINVYLYWMLRTLTLSSWATLYSRSTTYQWICQDHTRAVVDNKCVPKYL